MAIFINHMPIQRFTFPGGECSVNVSGIDINERVEIDAYLYSSDDVMSLLLSVNAIRVTHPKARLHLRIPYFPYARQDRVCNAGEAFSLEVMASLINGLECESVTVIDPHSSKTMQLIHRAHQVTLTEILRGSALEALIVSQNILLLAPDKGAVPKVLAYQRDLADRGIGVDVECCSKVRDPKTGAILRTELPHLEPNRNIMIVDDICDGGRTFIELAKLIKARGVESLYLYVTHGIFSKGLGPLGDFSHLFCYHSFRRPTPEEQNRLTIIGGLYAR